METICFCEHTLSWFKSYLSKWALIVNIDDKFSNSSKIYCGVSKGWIRGPLVFLVYFNEMPQAVSTNLLLYADDFGLVVQNRDKGKIEKQ